MPKLQKKAALPIGADYKPIQAGAGIQSRDATTPVPVESPFNLTAQPGAAYLLQVPDSAIQVTIKSDGRLRYGDNALLSTEHDAPQVVGGGWNDIPAGVEKTLDCCDNSMPIYICNASSRDGGAPSARVWVTYKMIE